MGWTMDLVTGLAEHLAGQGVGTWQPDTGYSDDLDGAAIVVGPNMPQQPDRIVCLTPYPVTDEPGLTEVVVAVQIRCRGTADPAVAEDLADDIYDVLHGATGLNLRGIPVAQVYRQSSAPLGPDTNHRHERSDNYYVQANRASPNADD